MKEDRTASRDSNELAPPQPALAPLLRLTVEVGAIATLGIAAAGERRFVPITGGSFESIDAAGVAGDWRGRVLPGGADWQWLRADDVLEVDARYILEDEQGQRVQVISQGLRHGPPEVIAALARGETVPSTSYYFRTAMRFEASAPALMHLNRCIAVGSGAREAQRVRLVVFAVG